MPAPLTRRSWLRAAALLPLAGVPALAEARAALAALEARHGGRLGVSARDTGSDQRLQYRAAERFPLCSTHKVLTAAAVLARVDAGRLRLDQHVAFGPADLQEYAPITRKNLAAGEMPLSALLAAMVAWSDNTAANLLLSLIGGPPGWTAYARTLGDEASRLDRTEPALNSAIPGDPRDTTTPAAMEADLVRVLLGDALHAGSRQQLLGWMAGNSLTGALLRAGMPQGWAVADKSGAGGYGTRNDIGLIRRPKGAPLAVSVYYTGSTAPMAERDAVIAAAGAIIAAHFA